MANKVNEAESKKEMLVFWYLIAGSLSDLSRLDFSKSNIQLLNINSDKIKDIVNQYDHVENRTNKLLEEIKEGFWDKERLYVMMPLDFSVEVTEEKYLHAWRVMLLLFPSDVSIYGSIQFQYFENIGLYWNVHTGYHFRPTGENELFDNYLYFAEEELGEINEFINIFLERFGNLEYVHIPFYSYVTSFSQNIGTMEYLSLCISLEAIVEAKSEVTYRMSRNLAILLGMDLSTSITVFNNIKKVYDLRSKIVHAGKLKDSERDLIIEHIPYLRNVVSRMIIEMILQNVSTLKDLNDKFTYLGFGDKEKISPDYKNMIPNITSFARVMGTELK